VKDYRKRLQACVSANGGYFEHIALLYSSLQMKLTVYHGSNIESQTTDCYKVAAYRWCPHMSPCIRASVRYEMLRCCTLTARETELQSRSLWGSQRICITRAAKWKQADNRTIYTDMLHQTCTFICLQINTYITLLEPFRCSPQWDSHPTDNRTAEWSGQVIEFNVA